MEKAPYQSNSYSTEALFGLARAAFVGPFRAIRCGLCAVRPRLLMRACVLLQLQAWWPPQSTSLT